MHTDTERCVRAVRSRDARSDDRFFTAVPTTRIHGRPSRPVVPPKAPDMAFHPGAGPEGGLTFFPTPGAPAGPDRDEARAGPGTLPGLGPRAVEATAMRALGDPDAFLPTGLGIRGAARRLGLPPTPAALTARAGGWRPWRACAAQYLWTAHGHPVNHLPA